MGQAKAGGNKEDRISQAVDRDNILKKQEAENTALRRELDLVARRERMQSAASKDNNLDLMDAVVEQAERSRQRRARTLVQAALIAAAIGGMAMVPSANTNFRRPFNNRMF